MTKKDWELIAKAICGWARCEGQTDPEDPVVFLVERLCREVGANYENFDQEKFKKACNPLYN